MIRYLMVFCTLVASAIAPPAQAGDTTLIINARLFDGTGDEVIEGASIVVRGERISEVIAGSADLPDAQVIDAEGRFVMPGLIDTHVHLGFAATAEGMMYPHSAEEYDEFVDTRMRDALSAFLDSGFTTLMSPGDSWPRIVDVKRRLESGDLRGPSIYVSGGIFTAPGGHPAVGICSAAQFCADHVAVQVDDPEDAREWVRKYKESGVDQLKLTYVEPDGPKLDPEVTRAIIDEANKIGIRSLIHAMDAADVNDLVEWGIDGFVHPFGISADDNGDLLRTAGEKGLAVTITLGTIESAEAVWGPMGEAERREYETTKANIEAMVGFGGIPVFGSDQPGQPASARIDTVTAAMQGLGMSNAEILRSATRDAAQVLLALPDVGTIEAGNIADIIILAGDPLDDIAALHDVEIVIQRGRVAKD